jgi:hypothetical protein
MHINEKWKLERKRRHANQRGDKQIYETENKMERKEDGDVKQRQQAKEKRKEGRIH